MKTLLALAAAAAALALIPSCSTNPAEASAREWQRAECNRVVDRDDREKCLKRVDR